MRCTIGIVGAGLLLTLTLALTTTTTAAESLPDGLIASPEPGWPQWRGPRRDGISDEKGLLQSWPEQGPKLLWKAGDLGTGWSSPICVGGRLYITGDVEDDLVIFALDLDGKPQWRAVNGKAWKGAVPGARAGCAFSEGRLYHMGAHGRVACLDAASGKELWAVDILERFQSRNVTWGLSECLLVDGPRLIVTPGGKTALVAALDKQTGETVWTTEPPANERVSYCSPILFRYAGRRLLASCSSGHGFGVDADSGKLLWTVPLRNRTDVNVSTPVYGRGSVLYMTPDGPDANLYHLRAAGATIQAEKAWNASLDPCTGSVVLVDGTAYGSGYFRHKSWVSLDWETGQIEHELKDLTTGAAIVADGRLYCVAEDGQVGLLKPTADGLQVAGKFRMVAEQVKDAWAHPVLLDGRLYLRYHDTLRCYDVRVMGPL